MEKGIQNLVSLLKQTYEKGAWHGPSVKEALENISDEQAISRLPDSHSIIELVAHMTAWRTYVIEKLKGNDAYKVADELNFPQIKNWKQAVQQLDESQVQLIAAIEKFPEEKLREKVAGFIDPYSYYTLLHSIIHHDLYHTGQIILIKKSTRPQSL
jgi:uncharacterized damage-inducible protein DinB